MKKVILFLIVLMAFGGQMAQARLISSRTFGERSKAPTMWILRTGLSLNNAAGSAVGDFKKEADYEGVTDFGIGCQAGYELSIAFNKIMGNHGLYWGMELGLGTRGASMHSKYQPYEDDDYMENGHWSILTWNVKYSPFTIGYKYDLNSSITLDAHLGAFVSFDFAGSGKCKWDIGSKDDMDYEEDSNSIGNDDLSEFRRFDCGIQFGVGVWYKKFNFDITYQRGFMNAYDFSVDRTDFYVSEGAKVYSSNLMLRVGYAF